MELFCKEEGYQSNKSVIDAVGWARTRCWKYDYVIELDIKGLFDNIDHELLMKVIDRHVKEEWMKLYIRRWLIAPFPLKDGRVEIDIYTVDEYKAIVSKLKGSIAALNNEIVAMQTEIKFLEESSSTEKLNVLLEFRQLIADPNLTYEMQNELYKTILDCVKCKRTEADGIELNILFK